MKKGIYLYAILKWCGETFRREFVSCKMKVEVLEESETRYKVRYIEPHARTQAIGGAHWVNKKFVTLSDPEVKPEQPSYQLRLPYKDND